MLAEAEDVDPTPVPVLDPEAVAHKLLAEHLGARLLEGA
jgi:hypothetical protein